MDWKTWLLVIPMVLKILEYADPDRKLLKLLKIAHPTIDILGLLAWFGVLALLALVLHRLRAVSTRQDGLALEQRKAVSELEVRMLQNLNNTGRAISDNLRVGLADLEQQIRMIHKRFAEPDTLPEEARAHAQRM
jgi:hypothetical protein